MAQLEGEEEEEDEEDHKYTAPMGWADRLPVGCKNFTVCKHTVHVQYVQ